MNWLQHIHTYTVSFLLDYSHLSTDITLQHYVRNSATECTYTLALAQNVQWRINDTDDIILSTMHPVASFVTFVRWNAQMLASRTSEFQACRITHLLKRQRREAQKFTHELCPADGRQLQCSCKLSQSQEGTDFIVWWHYTYNQYSTVIELHALGCSHQVHQLFQWCQGQYTP